MSPRLAVVEGRSGRGEESRWRRRRCLQSTCCCCINLPACSLQPIGQRHVPLRYRCCLVVVFVIIIAAPPAEPSSISSSGISSESSSSSTSLRLRTGDWLNKGPLRGRSIPIGSAASRAATPTTYYASLRPWPIFQQATAVYKLSTTGPLAAPLEGQAAPPSH